MRELEIKKLKEEWNQRKTLKIIINELNADIEMIITEFLKPSTEEKLRFL